MVEAEEGEAGQISSAEEVVIEMVMRVEEAKMEEREQAWTGQRAQKGGRRLRS